MQQNPLLYQIIRDEHCAAIRRAELKARWFGDADSRPTNRRRRPWGSAR